MEYPIKKLNPNITSFLNKVISADILGAINTGLRNDIEMIDDGCHMSDFASIAPNPIENTSDVRLSMAYCQYFWLICDVAIKFLDRKVIVDSCKESGVSIEQFLSYTQQVRKLTIDQVAPFLPPFIRSSAESYLAYLALVPELLKDNFATQIQDELDAAMSIKCIDKPILENVIESIDLNNVYSEKVNSVYTYGIGFLLLHEMAHHSLDHLQKETDEQDEMNADLSAFWSIYNDINGIERFSANVGILCIFFSFLMFDPEQRYVENHPKDYKRLFVTYDEIKGESRKYTQLIKGLFDFWASTNEISDYPYNLPENEDSIEVIRLYLENKFEASQ